MKFSKKNQRTMVAEEKSSMKFSENEPGEETLEMVQGGVPTHGPLSPEEMAHATQIVDEVAIHHGTNVGAYALNYGLAATVTFGAYAAGTAITKPKKN